MATTRQFSTGGGFPYDNSPGRTIEFTVSYGESEQFNPDSMQHPYTYHIEFSNPEDRAYVCAMYGPPRDEEGLHAFALQLGDAYSAVSKDPDYAKLPVPPLPFRTQDDADRDAATQVQNGIVARSCLWAQQFGPGTNLAIDIANGPGANAYRAQAIGGDNQVVAEQSGLAIDARDARILGRRAIRQDGTDSGVINSPSSADGFDPTVPTQPASLQQIDSNPVRRLVRVNGGASPTALENLLWNLGRSQVSPIDAGAPAALFASNRQNLFDNANGVASPAGDPGGVFAPPTSAPQDQQGPLSLNEAYLLHRKRLDANALQASAMDAGVPAAPLAPPDDSNFSGGLLGRIAALMGVDPQNPDRLAPPQDDELRAFYRDYPAQPWNLPRLR
jgi:hypothetical protein